MTTSNSRPRRNSDLYNSRHEAYLAFKSLKNHPYWFEDDGMNAYIGIDLDEGLWLPIQESPAYPIEWRKKYVYGEDEN